MDFNDANYHSFPAISASGINCFLNYGAAAYWANSPFNINRQPEEKSEALIMGSLTHMLVLESSEKFDASYIIIPEGMRRDKRSKDYSELLEQAETGKKDLVTAKMHQEAKVMAEALLKNKVARQIMQEGTYEEPMLWERDGIKCKIKTDFFRKGLIVDYKTTRENTPEDYFRAAANLGYHRAAAWYLDGVEAVKGTRPQGMLHIVQNKDYPENIGFPVFTKEMIEAGTVENEFAFAEICKRLLSGDWSDWPQKIINAAFPEWYKLKGQHNADNQNGE